MLLNQHCFFQNIQKHSRCNLPSRRFVQLCWGPNITGELGYMRDDVDVYQFASGAFSIASGGSGYTGENRVAGIKWTFSANRSNSAYAAIDTVQPASVFGMACIKV